MFLFLLLLSEMPPPVEEREVQTSLTFDKQWTPALDDEQSPEYQEQRNISVEVVSKYIHLFLHFTVIHDFKHVELLI